MHKDVVAEKFGMFFFSFLIAECSTLYSNTNPKFRLAFLPVTTVH